MANRQNEGMNDHEYFERMADENRELKIKNRTLEWSYLNSKDKAEAYRLDNLSLMNRNRDERKEKEKAQFFAFISIGVSSAIIILNIIQITN